MITNLPILCLYISATDPIHPNSTERPNRMKSVLVRTGVYDSEKAVLRNEVNHLHRDTICRAELAVPTFTCDDVLDAVETILREEEVVNKN